MKLPVAHFLAAIFCAANFFAFGPTASAVVLKGNPFTPLGANFEIFALQGIDASNPIGQSGFNPQVNQDFEFKGSTGVSYDDGTGHLKDFGLGLYNNAQHQVQSTGVNIHYFAPVDAASVTITVEDFDIQAGHDTFFKTQKVEPSILLLGAGNSVFASAKPTDIFPNLVPRTGANTDIWDLNFGALLNSLHLADGQITGFILYADSLNGETPGSDPYLLVSAGNGMVVPEPANYVAGLGAILFAALFHFGQVRAKRRGTVE
jgi:hypothetical protein